MKTQNDKEDASGASILTDGLGVPLAGLVWDATKPAEKGVYAWRDTDVVAYALVRLHMRPTDHQPGGQLNGSVLGGSKFYEGCRIDQWGGEWIGPLPE